MSTTTRDAAERDASKPLTIADIRGLATIDVAVAGQLLSLSRPAAYAAVHRGEIPVLRFGRRMVVPVPQLLALLGETPQ